MKKISRLYFLNIFYILILLAIMGIKEVANVKSIPVLLSLFLLVYVLFVLFSFAKLKSLKKMLTSVDFIYESVFVFYSIAAAIMFIIDGYKPRVRFFAINENNIYGTLNIYFYINCLFIIMIQLFNGPKLMVVPKDYFNNIELLKKFTIWDVVALIIVFYYYYLHFRNGIQIFGMYFQDLRVLIRSEINGNLMTYLFLYMIIYSFLNITSFIYHKENNYKMNYKGAFVIILLVFFWGLSLLTGRRNLINLLLMLMIVYFSKLKKVKLKKIFIVLVIVLIFLSISFFRSGAEFSKEKLNDFIFLSNGEFVLVHYVSEFYYDYDVELKYGSTYIYDTLVAFIPRFLFPKKPEMLSNIFVEQAHTNVGYAYNPVAEGIVNFGKKGAVLIVPFILYFFVFLAIYLGRKNPFYYVIICGYSINFFRGTFSVTIFALMIMIVSTKLILGKQQKNF